MIRILLVRALLFATPFALYAAWVVLSGLGGRTANERAPWTMLFAAGLSLVAASFIYVGLTEGQSTSGVYVAPHVENGHVVPGHVEKRPP